MRDDIERLLWEDLDGTLDAEAKVKLELKLSGDPAARALGERAAETVRLLEEVEEVPAPASLRTRIEAQIAAREEPASSPTRAGFRNVLLTPWVPRFAYMAAGILVGALAVQLLGSTAGLPGRDDASELYGVMSFQMADPSALMVPVPDAGGRVSLQAQGDRLVANLQFSRQEPVDVILHSEGGLAVSSLNSGSANVDVTTEPSTLVLRVSGGGRCLLVTEVMDPERVVVVSVKTGGRTLVEEKVRLAELPQEEASRTDSRQLDGEKQ